MRLIDADALNQSIENSYLTKGEKRLLSIKVRHAPTVETSIEHFVDLHALDTAAKELEKRPQGEWKFDWSTYCSECGYRPKIGGGNFCSNCGAKMINKE